MHGTNSRSGTMIPCTDSRSRAVIPTQMSLELTANDSKPRAANEPSAIYRSRATMPCTDSEPRAMNSTGDAERIDLKQDLQITSSSNGQRSMNLRNRSSLRLGQSMNLWNRSSLRLGRILRPTFKV
jgi:hypothetical protein